MFIHKGKKASSSTDESIETREKELQETQEKCSCCNNSYQGEAISQEVFDKLLEQNENCKKELEEVKEKLVRVAADFQNFQRRVEKEKAQWIFVTQSELLHAVLDFVDDFDRAFEAIEREAKNVDLTENILAGKVESQKELGTFVQGFAMTRKSLQKFLEVNGVTQMDQIKDFDPNLHEAISQVESGDFKSGEIVVVAQKGYMLKGQVLRPAKVVVAK